MRKNLWKKVTRLNIVKYIFSLHATKKAKVNYISIRFGRNNDLYIHFLKEKALQLFWFELVMRPFFLTFTNKTKNIIEESEELME